MQTHEKAAISTALHLSKVLERYVVRKVLFPTCLIEHIPLSPIKMTYPKKTLEKKVLKDNGYQKSIISNIFNRITKNHSLSQTQQHTQATYIQEDQIKMSINLPYVEDTSEKVSPTQNRTHILH